MKEKAAKALCWTARPATLYATIAPAGDQPLAFLGINGANRVRHQIQHCLGKRAQETFDGVAIAEIGGHAVDDHGLRLERAQHCRGVRIGEDVQRALVQQDVTPVSENPKG